MIYEEARAALAHDLFRTAAAGGDNGKPGVHRFGDDDAVALLAR
jgi:hypothetical protein